MQKYKSPTIDVTKFVVNPFSYTLEIPVVKMDDTSKFVKQSDGELYFAENTFEYEKSIKVYVSSTRRKVINQLSPNASKLLHWVEQELDYNKDYFWLNKARYMDETGVAYNTYKKSVGELQQYGFISLSVVTDVFWINPHFFFFGNRIGKYPKSVKIKQDNRL
jgi:hypothetical protein